MSRTPITALAVSPDRSHLAAATIAGEIVLIDRSRRRARWGGMRVEALVDCRLHPAILAHRQQPQAVPRSPPANIQWLSRSLATTRSMAERVPNGLLQTVQQNGSSCLMIRAGVLHAAKSACG